ncbi:MAG: hypothetical protein IPP90_22940 [Gemmatimonadaceae bacterium]|nr:hypothetical protein [Gemmatimonadaceae bacterium]
MIPQTLSFLAPRWGRVATAWMLAVAVVACDKAPRRVAMDSLLDRDLTLAGAAAPSPLPLTLSDTAPTGPTTPARVPQAVHRTPTTQRPRPPRQVVSTPSAAAPLPSPTPVPSTLPESVTPDRASAAGTRHALGSGSILTGQTTAQLCSLANRPGDRIVASLSTDVASPDGGVLRAGTPILVEMAVPSDAGFAFRVIAVQVDGVLIPITGIVRVDGPTTRHQVSKGGNQGKVIGGAVAGAILGRVLGGGAKGTVIGAAGGAAAGTIAASRNTVTDVCLPSGANLTVTLSAPLVLTTGTP